MFKTWMTPLLASLALVSAPAFASPVATVGLTGNTAVSTIASSNSSTKDLKFSCTAGNFKGEVWGYVSQVPNSPTKVFHLSEYRITKYNGQSGGNKANINVSTVGYSKNSPDSMIQDGTWRHLGYIGNVRNYNGALNVQFVFDKSGSDPRCTASQII